MVSLADIARLDRASTEYQCRTNLNLYDSPLLERLATQAVSGRQLRIVSLPPRARESQAVFVRLCEDDYFGWLPIDDLDFLEAALEPYRSIALTKAEIRFRLPQVITYARAAMAHPNHYLWGGTVGPNYDCSGLMQTAFAAAGIWLPRDAYQQADFIQPIAPTDLQPGDLIFFCSSARINHVGLSLGAGQYIHSSGKDQGRNGIAIDLLSEQGDAINRAYYRQLHGAGRVVASYQPPQHLRDLG